MLAANLTKNVQALRDLRQTIEGLPDRARTFAQVVTQSGLLFEFTPTGIARAILALTKGGRNPSLIYALHGANSPDKIALYWRDRRVTFRELDDRMNRAAA